MKWRTRRGETAYEHFNKDDEFEPPEPVRIQYVPTRTLKYEVVR